MIEKHKWYFHISKTSKGNKNNISIWLQNILLSGMINDQFFMNSDSLQRTARHATVSSK